MKRVTVLIPCYNEEAGIGAVIKGFPKGAMKRAGYDLEVIVIDNNSTDNTREVAVRAGARVIGETKKGKGNAIRTGFYSITDKSDYVVMLDGDDTYRPHEILRLLEPLDSGFADVIVGSRLSGKMRRGSMKGFNRIGNWLFTFMVRNFYKVNVTDVLTGYFAWRRESIYKLRPHLKTEGFAIEMEMITKMARLGLDIYSVPITYNQRAGESSLRPLYDGWRILKCLVRHLRWRSPVTKIAFVSDAIYPYHKGGKETRLYEISRGLVSEGRQVSIYTMKWWPGKSRSLVRDGVRLHAISRFHPLYKGDKRSFGQAILFSLACFKLLFVKFDVIDVDHMPFFPLFSLRLVCWLRRKKLNATWHEVWGYQYWQTYITGWSGRVAAIIEKLAFKLPDRIISDSVHTTKQLLRAGVKREITTVPLGVNVEHIQSLPPHRLRSDVIYAGRLISHKHIDKLIRAIKIVKRTQPGIKCFIVGSGPERDQLKQLVRRKRLSRNIEFFDFFEDQNELFSLMKASKVFVLPSTREGFGLVVAEANAAGIPVVTTKHRHNAARDLISHGKNGYLVNVNERSIASGILEAIDVKPEIFRKHIKQRTPDYDWSSVVKNVEKTFALSSD